MERGKDEGRKEGKEEQMGESWLSLLYSASMGRLRYSPGPPKSMETAKSGGLLSPSSLPHERLGDWPLHLTGQPGWCLWPVLPATLSATVTAVSLP